MQANISLILNIILLIGVVVAMTYVMITRRGTRAPTLQAEQNTSTGTETAQSDDIIAVRKIPSDLTVSDPNVHAFTLSPADLKKGNVQEKSIHISSVEHRLPKQGTEHVKTVKRESHAKNQKGKNLMLFLLAKDNRQFTGYELLQTLLASGLRFGEGNIFHRHQQANGQGPVMCSLAAATATGTFDLQNIGAFSVRGMCLFMETSGNATIDEERFAMMLDTGRQLSESLGAYLLDSQKRPFTEAKLASYHALLRTG